MGQHPVYNGVIKSKGAIKMTRKELQTMLKQLSEYQVNQISQTMQRFLALNQELAEIEPDTCPCCGDQKAVFIRKGIMRGKQRFQCKSCGRKFTYDTKQLTSNSHQPMESWIVVLEDTLSLASLNSTAEKIGVCHSTAFRMRHKLLVYMEEVVTSSSPLEALIEADETDVIESQKGTKVTHRKPRRHGESSGKRGLSNDQLCICVATDRDHHGIARCVNRAKPGSEDIMNALGDHIAEKSVLLFDGITSYNYLAEQKNCEKVSLVGHESYNKVYHLNTVNSLHSRFKAMMRKLRGVATKYLNRYAALFSTTGFFAGELNGSSVLNTDSSPTHDWYAVFIAREITAKYIGTIYTSVVGDDTAVRRGTAGPVDSRTSSPAATPPAMGNEATGNPSTYCRTVR